MGEGANSYHCAKTENTPGCQPRTASTSEECYHCNY